MENYVFITIFHFPLSIFHIRGQILMAFLEKEHLEQLLDIRKRYCTIVSYPQNGQTVKRFKLVPNTPKKYVLILFRSVFCADDNVYKDFENIDWELKRQFEKRCYELNVDVERCDEFDILPDNIPDEIIQLAQILDKQFVTAGFSHWFINFVKI